jgi:hypothetical protein
MAGTGKLTRAFIQDALDLAIAAGDVVKLAFGTAAWAVDENTAAYSVLPGEVTNLPNVPAGGITLTGLTGGNGSLATAYKDWENQGPVVVGTMTARKALAYNETRGGRTIAFFDFGADKTATDEPFPVTIPAAGTGVVRFSN